MPANFAAISRGPAGVDPHIATDGPAELLQAPQERGVARLRFRIVDRSSNEHSKAPHPHGLLRPRSHRPCSGAAQQSNELTPPHSRPSSTMTRPHYQMIAAGALWVIAALRLRVPKGVKGVMRLTRLARPLFPHKTADVVARPGLSGPCQT